MRPLPIIALLLALLAGCGPKVTPVAAERELAYSGVPHRAAVARVGESLVAGAERYVLPAFQPAFPGTPPVPDAAPSIYLRPGAVWTVHSRLCDGTLLVEPPAGSLSSALRPGLRLGLRVDRTGRVVGHRPWFDLTRGCRISQPYWGKSRRAAFRPAPAEAVDEFVFDLRYKGMDGTRGVLERTEFKRTGVKGGGTVELPVEERDVVGLPGLEVLIFGLYPDHVRFIVDERPQ
ncbi:MAG: hypothetical protein AB7D39_14175 [Pseudodesulfovibrio sp.]|uniref:hypothetical protein n=1 Tax=Pseudodesulfovibrio sp. TaxID=2035812 RepID=UPI003D132CEB